MATEATYDVFLSHATHDKPKVEDLARRLKAEGLKPFLDKWHLVPGEPWQEAIEIAMARSRTCLVFVGPGPLGPWQNEEMRSALDMRVRDNSRRVIPVLLPGASLSVLPPFLARLTWVDFRSGFNDPQAFQRLVRGIQGKEPEDGQAGSSAGQAPWQRPRGKNPKAKDLRQLWFEWPESLYGRFNFQRDEHIDALTEWLLGTGLPAVVVLGGEPGIGRSFLCDAAARRARDQGNKVAVWHLDLDGFEPDVQNPLSQYLRHLIDQEERHPEEAREGAVKSAVKALSELDLLGPASEVAASLLSLLWQFVASLKRFAALLDQPPRDTGVPPRDDPDTLHRFLSEITRDRKLLVHVSDGLQLTSNLRRRLIREAERSPERLLLVISCPLEQATERVAPATRSQPERFDVLPLNAAELRNLLDQRFEPNELPDDLVALLMRRCRGWPVATANLLADLMEAEILDSEGEIWKLPQEGLQDSRLVGTFSRGLFEEVDEALVTLAEEKPELARELREFLSLAALCGRYIPSAALLEHLGLDEAMADEATDWVDYMLVGELGWLTDLGFHIPGFRGHSVYAFAHSLLPLVVLDQESEMTREVRATHLLLFLENRVQVTNRGWARCFLSIAEHLNDRERAPYERRLAWWVGLDAVIELQAEVRTELEREKIDPELVWRVARYSNDWPAYRRLALLDAYAQATIGQGEDAISVLSFNLLADFHLLRADLLRDLGRYAESIYDAESALRISGNRPEIRAQSLNISGLARLAMGDALAAKIDLEEALALNLEHLGEVEQNTLVSRDSLAQALWELGDLITAKQHQEQVLRIQEDRLGHKHPETFAPRNNLAATFLALGEVAEARGLLEQTLEIQEEVLGDEHPGTLAVKDNLAIILRSLGDSAGARTLQEKVLEAFERTLGREHPDTLTARNNLAQTLSDLGDFAGARKLAEETLKTRERMLGLENPATTLTAYSLLRIVRYLEDPVAEAQLIDKLRWLLDRAESSVLDADQRTIRKELLNLLNPS